jgi:hypothetical protein
MDGLVILPLVGIGEQLDSVVVRKYPIHLSMHAY